MTRMARLSYVLVVGLILAAAGCAKQDAAATAPVTRPPVAVSVAPVVTGDLQESIDVVGSLAPKFSADVKSEVTGTVTAIYVTEWVPVRKGQPLARLDTRETEATIDAIRATVSQAMVAQSRAKREFERAQQLKQFGLITPQSFDDARTAVEAADAAVSSANAQVKTAESRLAKSSILSPMDGVVALRGVSVGDRVENMGGNSPVFRIVDNRVLDLTVSVPSSQMSLVKIGQPIQFTTDTQPGRTFSGKVMFINPSLDATSRSAQIVAEVPNPGGVLRGGAFVKGRILVASRSGVLQVPRDALVTWNVEKRSGEVFVVRGDQAERRTVTTGAPNGSTVEIVSGLTAGEQVVVRGGFSIGQGDKVAVTKGEGA